MLLFGKSVFFNHGYLRIKTSNFIRQYATSPRLTPHEVTRILRSNEYSNELHASNSIKYYDSNQLASNNPIEDTRSEARCKLTNGFLLGIFDGHGGNACAQVIAKRLFYYISASLIPTKILKKILAAKMSNLELKNNLLEHFNDNVELMSELGQLYGENLLSFIKELSERSTTSLCPEMDFQMELALENAFLALDRDISNEALKKLDRRDAARVLSVAMSGSVAVVAHIDGPHLHVAGVGDCQAVLGVHTGRASSNL